MAEWSKRKGQKMKRPTGPTGPTGRKKRPKIHIAPHRSRTPAHTHKATPTCRIYKTEIAPHTLRVEPTALFDKNFFFCEVFVDVKNLAMTPTGWYGSTLKHLAKPQGKQASKQKRRGKRKRKKKKRKDKKTEKRTKQGEGTKKDITQTSLKNHPTKPYPQRRLLTFMLYCETCVYRRLLVCESRKLRHTLLALQNGTLTNEVLTLLFLPFLRGVC